MPDTCSGLAMLYYRYEICEGRKKWKERKGSEKTKCMMACLKKSKCPNYCISTLLTLRYFSCILN